MKGMRLTKCGLLSIKTIVNALVRGDKLADINPHDLNMAFLSNDEQPIHHLNKFTVG